MLPKKGNEVSLFSFIVFCTQIETQSEILGFWIMPAAAVLFILWKVGIFSSWTSSNWLPLAEYMPFVFCCKNAMS